MHAWSYVVVGSDAMMDDLSAGEGAAARPQHPFRSCPTFVEYVLDEARPVSLEARTFGGGRVRLGAGSCVHRSE